MAINRRDDVLRQYADSSKLASRAELHARYSTADEAWPQWTFDRVLAGARGRVLEVGGGPGWLWRSNIDRVPGEWRVVATDISHGMVSEASRALDDPRFSFAVADAMALPLEDERFDTLVANHMLYHVPDVGAALAEFVRVLRPDGVLIAATNGERHFAELRPLLPATNRWAAHITAFGLETGPSMVAEHFADVDVERHPTVLEVPDAEPVVRYVASMPSRRISDDVLADVRRHVEDVLSRDGIFRITTDSGLITARKR
jgi:SAM-dependent methyltransferase